MKKNKTKARKAEQGGKLLKIDFNKAFGLAAEGPSAAKAEKAERLALWKDEIMALQSQRFNNIDQALHALIDRVIQKLDEGRKSSEHERTFLYDLLSDDPEITQVLNDTLNIGDR